MPASGLTLTQQPPLSTATVRIDAPLSDVWQRLATTETIQDAIETGVRDLVGHLKPGRRALALEQCGVSALDGLYASAVATFADPETSNELRYEQARQLTGEFGAAQPSIMGLYAPAEGIVDGPLAVLRVAEVTPTVSVRIDDAFDELRADQRSEVVDLLADLANVVDLRVVATGRWQRKLARDYREQLPAVSEQCSAGLSAGTIAALVEDARNVLAPDGREVRILRQLAAEPAETVSYNELYATHEVSKGAIRQCLTHGETSLSALGLVETFSRATDSGHAVELLAAGRRFLDTLDSEIGRQQRLETVVSESGNPSDDSRVTPPACEGRPTAEAEAVTAQPDQDTNTSDRNRLSNHHQIRSASRHRYAAAVGSTSNADIGLVDHPIAKKPDRAEPHWYYDHEDDRLLVGAEYDNPTQWWTCIALSLASRRTFRHVLTPERFDEGKLGDLLADHIDILRNSRCLGYLKDADATPEAYTNALLAAAEDLRELTQDLHHENYENETRFRGTILSEALGLAGTLVHLLDIADVDVVREARIPRFSRDFKTSQKNDLVETLSIGATIQSHYGEFAAYRQLFEFREEKRDGTYPPTVDAEDPYGELIGSFVLVGPSVPNLAEPLRRRLSNRELHDDAPEFGVPIQVDVADERRHTRETVDVMCRQKSLRPTRATTSMLAAFTGTPYDVARALHNLGNETKAPGRKLRLDEVRYALSALDANRILPEMSKPALSRIVHTLLAAETPLVQSELAERADVSARSVRTHAERLAAFDFIRNTNDGWRFSLPFHIDEERGETILPWFVAPDRENEILVRDVLAEVVYDQLDTERYADPEDPIAGILFGDPGMVVPALQAAWGWLDPWIESICVLLDTATDHVCTAAVSSARPEQQIATVGSEPAQMSLTTATESA